MRLRSITSPRVVIPAIAIAGVVMIIMTICTMGVKTTVSKHRVQWENISSGFGNTVYRTEVPGGWLIKTRRALTFVADPEHKWLNRTSR